MPTVNPLFQNGGAHVAGSQNGDVSGSQEADETQGVYDVGAPTDVQPQGVAQANASSFEAVRSTGASNILSTPPPAENVRTSTVNVAEAIGRMQQLKNGIHPIVQGLVASSEDGTAPPLPSQGKSVGSGGAAPAAPAATDKPNASKTEADGSKSNAMSSVATRINTDVSEASEDIAKDAAQIKADDSVSKSQPCGKPDQYPGEVALQGTLKGMGLSHDEASAISRMLNDADNTISHSPAEQVVLATAIATYNKLGEHDPSHTGEPSKEIVANLRIAAANYEDGFTNKAANYDSNDAKQMAIKDASTAAKTPGSGTATGAYTTSMNALQDYIMQVSNDSALTALTTPAPAPSAASRKPFNWVVLE